MTPGTPQQSVTKDAVWQAWIEKGLRHDRAMARKFKVVAGIVLPLLALGIAYYLFAIK